MSLPKRGEKGFTLIELLIVVAILGVLAAVVIPNVGRFIGRGETEAAETELANIQASVTAMMVDNNLATLPFPVGTSTNDMNAFPDVSSNATGGYKSTDPEGYTYDFSVNEDVIGYLLYQHDINAKDDPDTDNETRVNYVATQTTSKYYTVDSQGTVQQHDTAGQAHQ